jgi:LL-diaminopimelate aminotransferase
MYLWVALPAGLSSAAFARRALEETGALVLPGSAFGPAGEGYFRIALIAGPDRLKEAAGRLGRFLEATRREELATTA